MGSIVNRRDFLKNTTCSVLGLAAIGSVRDALAQPAFTPPVDLTMARRTIEVNGRAVSVYGLLQPDGTRGIVAQAGGDFAVNLINQLGEPTLIHWHGLTPPWMQDGVPDSPMPMLAPGEIRPYRFALRSGGTHWMHAHTLQEQNLLAAPLIVRVEEDDAVDEHNVVMMLHDFSFTPAEELLARLRGGMGGGHTMHHGGGMHGAPADKSGGAEKKNADAGHGMAAMGGMDLNDIEYDAYLANERTLADPEVIRVENGGKVRLRIINGATATAFTVDLGALMGELIAVDGHDIEPVTGSVFPMTMAQRLDIRLTLPKTGAAFPILALREGASQRTGIILAPQEAEVRRISETEEKAGPLVGLDLERRLRARYSLPVRAPDKRFSVTLDGTMEGYNWWIDGGDALKVSQGNRVEITMRNKSMMAHPMHLHGHVFQVVALDGIAMQGAVRDTVLVPPGATVTVVFDADNPGRWPFHCHHLYHMVTGMMSFVTYDGFA